MYKSTRKERDRTEVIAVCMVRWMVGSWVGVHELDTRRMHVGIYRGNLDIRDRQWCGWDPLGLFEYGRCEKCTIGYDVAREMNRDLQRTIIIG